MIAMVAFILILMSILFLVACHAGCVTEYLPEDKSSDSMKKISDDIGAWSRCAAELTGRTPDEERQIRFIIEHLRIARAQLSYAEQLKRGEHPSASRPGELDWAIGASELALTFTARRMHEFDRLNAYTTN